MEWRMGGRWGGEIQSSCWCVTFHFSILPSFTFRRGDVPLTTTGIASTAAGGEITIDWNSCRYYYGKVAKGRQSRVPDPSKDMEERETSFCRRDICCCVLDPAGGWFSECDFPTVDPYRVRWSRRCLLKWIPKGLWGVRGTDQQRHIE